MLENYQSRRPEEPDTYVTNVARAEFMARSEKAPREAARLGGLALSDSEASRISSDAWRVELHQQLLEEGLNPDSAEYDDRVDEER